jgi:GNAT superfamily N-acetyltransferase
VSERIEAVDRPTAPAGPPLRDGAVNIASAPYDSAPARWVVAQAEEELVARYGALTEGERGLTAAMFDPPSGAFLVALARARSGPLPLGGVGLRRVDPSTGEIKRLWVHPDHRGTGMGSALMGQAESVASAIGYHTLRLSTGPRQPEAIALYERTGWVRRDEHWGDGPVGDCSYHFTKDLA